MFDYLKQTIDPPSHFSFFGRSHIAIARKPVLKTLKKISYNDSVVRNKI